MVREAEEFAEEDKKVNEKIDARNALETYVYNMKNQISDKVKLADKLEADEKDKIEAATKEALEWLDNNLFMTILMMGRGNKSTMIGLNIQRSGEVAIKLVWSLLFKDFEVSNSLINLLIY
ncbi:putative Heat shock protein 70 family [Helianthus anomalus]